MERGCDDACCRFGEILNTWNVDLEPNVNYLILY